MSIGRLRLWGDDRAAYPAAFEDAGWIGDLAFEEFRQLVRSGREVTPQLYAEKYAVDVSAWPTPDEILCPTYRTYVEPTPAALAREASRAARPERPIQKMPRIGDRFLH